MFDYLDRCRIPVFLRGGPVDGTRTILTSFRQTLRFTVGNPVVLVTDRGDSESNVPACLYDWDGNVSGLDDRLVYHYREPPLVETLVGPLVGYRWWRANEESGLLHGVHYPVAWPLRRALRARGHVTPGCPHADFTCGIYALRAKPTSLFEPVAAQSSACVIFALVFGQVALWGRAVEHELGWRAEYAYPTRLWVWEAYSFAERLTESLADNYGVACEVVKNYTEVRPDEHR